MRVLALGGSGSMGGQACRVIAAMDAVGELVIADRDGDAAAALAAALGPRARALTLDVTDASALAAALDLADVVVNTVGPFFRFGVPILAAAIEARRHYLDICDDWEPTLDMLALDDRARAAGVTAIIGLGATPGVSNLLAVLAARELDTVTELVTGWNAEAARPEPDENSGAGPSAAIVHGIQQMTGMIRVVRDGAPVDERPLQRLTIDYPGVGTRRLWTFGHPEPLTLTRTIEGVRTSINGAFGRASFMLPMHALRALVDRRLISPARAARLAGWAERTFAAPALNQLFAPTRLPPLFAHAAGMRDGRAASVAAALCRFPGTTMAAMTGVPLAIGLELLARGEITARGVLPPEAAIDPHAFFRALAAHCPGDRDPMYVITRTWDPAASSDFAAAVQRARAVHAHSR